MRFFILLLSLFVIFDADASEITDIRIGSHPDKTRLVIEMTGDTDFHAAVMKSPNRLVIHTPTKHWNIGGNTQMVAPFANLKHQSTKGTLSQIVFDLKNPTTIRNAYLLPADSGHPKNRLVIDVAETTYIHFEKQVGQAFGSLDIGALSNQSLDDLLQNLADNDIVPVPDLKPIKTPLRKPIIVIDAGHGGKDPGAISPGGIREKDIVLPMAKMIARVLNESGRYDARLTRTKDVYIKLYNRVKIARKADADVFISVHADSVRNHKTKGASIYTLSNTASDKQTAKLAARENRSDIIAGVDLGIEDKDVSMILLDLSMRDTMNQSKNLANTVVQSFRGSGVPTLKGPHRYAGFAVLKAPDVPSILVETGFVSNESEARKLKKPAFQRKIGQAILKSLDGYFDAVN